MEGVAEQHLSHVDVHAPCEDERNAREEGDAELHRSGDGSWRTVATSLEA